MKANLPALQTRIDKIVDSNAYAEWLASPITSEVLETVADLLTPPPLDSAQRSQPTDVLNALVRRELVETFVDAACHLSDFSSHAPGRAEVPQADYGADDELTAVKRALEAARSAADAVSAPAVKPRARRKTPLK